MNLESLARYAPIGLTLLRIVAALLFIEHGTQKFFDFPASGRPMASLPPLFILAGLIETIGGILVLIGLFTRYAAFIMSGEMAVAYWFYANRPAKGFMPVQNGGTL
jgi:putative oxidoreductase